MRTVAVVLAFMCSGCAALIAPSGPPVSVSLLNSDFEQLKQDEKTYWEDNARAIAAVKAFQRKVEVFRASLTKTEQGRFDQFWGKPSQEAAIRIPYIDPSEIVPVPIPSNINELRQQYSGFSDMSDRELKAWLNAKKLSKEKWGILNSKATAIAQTKTSKAIELHNQRADFFKLVNIFDEREKNLKARRASLEQQRRDNIAHLETLAALGDIQQAQEQAQMLNTLLMMTPTPAARAPLPPAPVFLTPPKRGVITGPGGTYYYREY